MPVPVRRVEAPFSGKKRVRKAEAVEASKKPSEILSRLLKRSGKMKEVISMVKKRFI